MQKMKLTNEQNAFDYAMYMMLGSCFAEAVSTNHFLEERMCIQFKEQRRDNQYLMEELVLGFLNKKLRKALPAKTWEQKARISLRPDGKGHTILILDAGELHMALESRYKGGRKASFHCRYQIGTSEPMEIACAVVRQKGHHRNELNNGKSA